MKYQDFAPTGFDPKGLALEDRQSWIVLPTTRNRDSVAGPLANFDSALEILGGESETVEVHRFGHWANGWFELILVHPDRQSEADDIERALEDYPILDEFKWSDYESNEAMETWDACSGSDFERELESRFETTLEIEAEDLWTLYRTAEERGNLYVEHTDEGACFPVERAAQELDREDIEPYIDRSVTMSVQNLFLSGYYGLRANPTSIGVHVWADGDAGAFKTLTPPVIPPPF